MMTMPLKSVTTTTAPASAAIAPSDHTHCLIGMTRLNDFLRFVRERVSGGRTLDPGDLAHSWREAATVFKGLQTSEAGAADNPDIKPLSSRLEAHVAQLVALPYFQKTFSMVPVAFGMVELDKLIVCQQQIKRASVDTMTRTLTTPLSDADLATVCLPLTSSGAGFQLALEEAGQIIFTSDTHDARFLDAQLVNPTDIRGLVVSGHAQTVLALSLGFTTNVLNVVRYGARIVLNNGYHRALALRELGVTHAPCVIQVCSHWEDVALAGASEMSDNGAVYFTAARPPLLRDFANSDLCRTFVTRPLRKQIRLTYEIETDQLDLS